MNAPAPTTIVATVSAVRFRNDDNGFVVLAINAGGFVSACGEAPPSILVEKGSRVEITGIAGEFRGKPQIKFTASGIKLLAPTTHDAPGLALRRADGTITGKHAEKLARAFGADYVDAIAADASLLDAPEFSRWKPATKAKIATACVKAKGASAFTKALLEIGTPAATIKKIEALELEKPGRFANPFALVRYGLISFTRADALAATDYYTARHGAPDKQAPSRAIGACFDIVNERRAVGHCGTETEALEKLLATQYAFTDETIASAIASLAPTLIRYQGARFSSDLFEAERQIAAVIQSSPIAPAVASPPTRALIASTAASIGLLLNTEQTNAIALAFDRPGVVCITGGPGTGKTTIARMFARLVGERRIRGCAFAGKAAVNLEAKTGVPSATIHKIAQLNGAGVEAAAGELRGVKMLIVDEASMIGTKLMRDVLTFANLAKIPHIALIGDIDQLDPIEPGAPFADMIASGVVPTAKLERVYRFADGGGIAALCADVRNAAQSLAEDYGGEVSLIEVSRDELHTEALNRYCALLNAGVDPADIGLLSPFAAQDDYGVRSLNNDVRRLLGRGSAPAIGDLVLCSKNNYARGVMNGARGAIEHVAKDGAIRVRFENSGNSVIYSKNELTPKSQSGPAASLQWGYALSVHKAQGGQFTHIIALLPKQAGHLFGAPLIYTAFSRAQQSLAVVGAIEQIPIIAKHGRLARTTALRSLLAATPKLEG